MTEQDMQWLTGFFEGDGCAYSGKTASSVIFVQKDSSILEYIQKSLGFGRLTIVVNEPYRSYRLYIGGRERCRELLDIFSRYVVSDYSLMRIKKLAEHIGMDGRDWQIHLPTIPWAVGFWDAEGVALAGSIEHYWVTRLGINIGVRDEQLLQRLRDKIGGSVVRGEKYQKKGVCPRLGLFGKVARRFILDILVYSHHLEKKAKLLDKMKIISLRKKKNNCAWRRFFWYIRYLQEATVYYKASLQSIIGGDFCQ